MKPAWTECEICGTLSERTPRSLVTNPPGPGPTMVGTGSAPSAPVPPAAHALVGMLVVQEYEQIHKLRAGTNSVGSAETNDVVLRGRFVSARHAVLKHSPESGFRVLDLDSTNGTFVNDERVREKTVSDGDRIRFGNIQGILKSVS